MVWCLLGIGSVKIKCGLSRNQEDVVRSNGNNSFLDGLPAGVGPPAGGVCGVGVVQASFAFVFGV